MRLYTFEVDGDRRLGAELEGRLVDLRAVHAVPQDEEQAHLVSDVLTLLRAGSAGLDAARTALDAAASGAVDAVTYDVDDVRLRAPVPRPGKILCCGVNYRGHLEENPEATLPEFPFFFAKLPSVVVGPGDPIVHPKRTRQLDYEVELAVVIGETLKDAAEAEVMAGVAGYTILHDVSARDVQFTDNQITLGKNFDTFAPMGPCIVTADEFPDPDNVSLRTYVNGELLQDGSTQDWFTPLPELLSFLSEFTTLEPGDVVTTGTPAGVGVFRDPQVFLQPGDRVVLEIDGIGRLENPVVAAE